MYLRTLVIPTMISKCATDCISPTLVDIGYRLKGLLNLTARHYYLSFLITNYNDVLIVDIWKMMSTVKEDGEGGGRRRTMAIDKQAVVEEQLVSNLTP